MYKINDNLVKYVENIEEACEFLKNTEGNVLVATGSEEIEKYTVIENYKDRIFARVLFTEEVVKKCNSLGFSSGNLIAIPGPFTNEFNISLIKQINAKYMIIKEYDKEGSYEEEIEAYKNAGVLTIIVGRPIKKENLTIKEAIKFIDNKFKLCKKRKVSLVSMGLGNINTMTLSAKEVFENADVIIGAEKNLKTLEVFNKPFYMLYKPFEIFDFIEKNKEYKNIAIAYSGDTGFYSSAQKVLKKLNGYNVEVVSGVSSLVYFASKLKITWEDIKIINGNNSNIINEVLNNKVVFTLLGGENSDFRSVCRKLYDYGFGYIKTAVGYNLSYDDEMIKEGLVQDFINSDYKELSVAVFINENFDDRVYKNIKDVEFIRDKAPIINEDVRSLSIINLGLKEDSILYDIGAGSGSISIEAALNVPRGKVYAIDKKEEAIELINMNKKKFVADNLKVVHGIAPEALMNLDIPTHAFIEGNSSNVKGILEVLLYKNPLINIVINSMTLEIMECIKEFPFIDIDITKVSAIKSNNVHEHNMTTEQNPIYIICLKGGK